MSHYAIVALPVGIDREFTYLIPPGLGKAVQTGVRVLVPFGKQLSTGLVVDLAASTDVRGIKPIRAVLDALPVMGPELLQLCRWLASYYVAPLGEVLRAAVPHGFTATSKRLVRPLPALTMERVEEESRRSSKRGQLLRTLMDDGAALSTDLARSVGIKNLPPILRDLESAGLIETDDVLPRSRTTPKFHDVVLLSHIDAGALARVRDDLSPRKKRARALLDVVSALVQNPQEEIPTIDLLRKAGAISAQLREFTLSGLIPVERREQLRSVDFGTEEKTRTIVLNEDQRNACETIAGAIEAHEPRTFLLHGVTGSGKTQVYIEAIRHCLAIGKDAIVLVPEISLTPQTVRRFKTHFGDLVGVVHSRMSPGERHDVWRLARRGEHRVVIGPRSALFAPLRSLGLIVVDEEHESSYKQYDATPRYHARDAAVVRGTLCKAVTVLGSATPSAESFHNASMGKFTLLRMPSRIDAVPMPSITIVDMTEERKRQYQEFKAALTVAHRDAQPQFLFSSISAILHEKIRDRLSRHEGIILLQNRRGYAPFVECPDCGYTERCTNCNVSLTYHRPRKQLRCHYCGMVTEPHETCPQCRGTNIRLLGVGTQRVEDDLARFFPDVKVLRMDLDTTSRKGAHDRLLKQFEAGESDILLGTQMVAKGLDFARVTLVGVISADTQMLLPDFRASERTFQLLTQVAGRAGRSTLKGEVIIQTHQPKHYSLKHVIDHDANAFFEEEIAGREELMYPPFSRLVLVETKGKDERKVRALAEEIGAALKTAGGTWLVLGPAPALIDRIKTLYRWHIIIKSPKQSDPSGATARHALREIVRTLGPQSKGLQIIIDVDPVGLM